MSIKVLEDLEEWTRDKIKEVMSSIDKNDKGYWEELEKSDIGNEKAKSLIWGEGYLNGKLQILNTFLYKIIELGEIR